MRTIKFIVNGQSLELDPSSNTNDLVPGTERYIKAEFIFSSEWAGYKKVAAFYSMLGHEYPPQLLVNDQYCVVPTEALAKRQFKMRILGKNGDISIVTNKLLVSQNGGRS